MLLVVVGLLVWLDHTKCFPSFDQLAIVLDCLLLLTDDVLLVELEMSLKVLWQKLVHLLHHIVSSEVHKFLTLSVLFGLFEPCLV